MTLAKTGSPAHASGSAPRSLVQGPYGLTTPEGLPMCEECDIPMQPYAGPLGGGRVEAGFSCAGCGWSFTT